MLVFFDRDSQTIFAEDGTKLLLDQICLSGSCFEDSETIISVQTKITRITDLLPYQVQQICANKFARFLKKGSKTLVEKVEKRKVNDRDTQWVSNFPPVSQSQIYLSCGPHSYRDWQDVKKGYLLC